MLPAPEIGIRAAGAVSQEPSTMIPILFARQWGRGGKAAAVGQMSVDLKSANYLKINCRNSFQSSAECACVRKCVCAHKIKYVNLNLTFE